MKKIEKDLDNSWGITTKKVRNILGKLLHDFVYCVSFIFNLRILLTLSTTILLFYFSSKTIIGELKLFYGIVASVLTGVLGGLVTNHFIELSNSNFALKKSVGAIRSLKLIKLKVNNLINRIAELKDEKNERDFDEIDNLASNIDKDILNSISDWGDINPNSTAVVDNFEAIGEIQAELKSLKKEKGMLENENQTLSASSAEEKEKLEARIYEKNKRISELELDVFNINRNNVGLTSGTPLNISNMSHGFTSFGNDSDVSEFLVADHLPKVDMDVYKKSDDKEKE